MTAVTWKGTAIDANSHWRDIELRNRQVLEAAHDAGLFKPEATKDDVALILDRWTFPLHSLDLRKREVTDDELQIERERGEERLARDWYGSANDY